MKWNLRTVKLLFRSGSYAVNNRAEILIIEFKGNSIINPKCFQRQPEKYCRVSTNLIVISLDCFTTHLTLNDTESYC